MFTVLTVSGTEGKQSRLMPPPWESANQRALWHGGREPPGHGPRGEGVSMGHLWTSPSVPVASVPFRLESTEGRRT